MANEFYTPSQPTMNFKYEPNRSEPQRMMDTMQQIKGQQQEDERFAMEKQKAELLYKTGMMGLQAAEAKMTKIQQEEQLDMEAGQMFNSLTATGTPPSEAFKMVGNLYLIKGGYSAYQKFQEEQNSLIKDVFSMGKDNPAAFGFVSDILKSRGVDVSPEQMQQQWALGKTVSIGDGRFASPKADGTWTITDQATPEMRQDRADKATMEKAKLAQGWGQINAQIRGQDTQMKIAQLGMEKAKAGYETKKDIATLNNNQKVLDREIKVLDLLIKESQGEDKIKIQQDRAQVYRMSVENRMEIAKMQEGTKLEGLGLKERLAGVATEQKILDRELNRNKLEWSKAEGTEKIRLQDEKQFLEMRKADVDAIYKEATIDQRILDRQVKEKQNEINAAIGVEKLDLIKEKNDLIKLKMETEAAIKEAQGPKVVENKEATRRTKQIDTAIDKLKSMEMKVYGDPMSVLMDFGQESLATGDTATDRKTALTLIQQKAGNVRNLWKELKRVDPDEADVFMRVYPEYFEGVQPEPATGNPAPDQVKKPATMAEALAAREKAKRSSTGKF